eukprot:14527305-Heterocapsa_arctica.AAC.1
MSNKSSIGMDTKVNWDFNILGERPNVKIQTDKKCKYRKRSNNMIAQHWYKTSTKREHMLYEHIDKCQSKIPTCQLHEDGIRATKTEIQNSDGRGMSYRHE